MARKIKIHSEGYQIILTLGGVLLLLNLALYWFTPDWHVIRMVVGGFSILAFVFTVAFFRVPFRFLAPDERAIIAPADGKIVVLEEVEEGEYFKDKRLQVSIFMSPTNVHVNRNPISGTVKYMKYYPGKYLVAWHPKSSIKNERNSVVIGNNDFDILVTQIAGKFARRIVNYLEVGDEAEQGQEFGFIKFGSRVDLFLPLGTRIDVSIGQKVKGGSTILGMLE